MIVKTGSGSCHSDRATNRAAPAKTVELISAVSPKFSPVCRAVTPNTSPNGMTPKNNGKLRRAPAIAPEKVKDTAFSICIKFVFIKFAGKD